MQSATSLRWQGGTLQRERKSCRAAASQACSQASDPGKMLGCSSFLWVAMRLHIVVMAICAQTFGKVFTSHAVVHTQNCYCFLHSAA